ncbi:MAG: SH3 domain-containing protein, partial [Myxococcota bacterium]
MALVVWFAACNQAPEPPAPAPVEAAPDRPQVEHTWVQASLLRLHVAPQLDAAWAPLAINTRVRVLERQGEWVRIISPDGRSGWVHEQYVATAPLTLDTVRQQVAAATDVGDRLTWLQRGAALAPTDPEFLGPLVAAYREAGQTAEADQIAAVLSTDEAERFDRWFAGQKDEVAAITAALPTVPDAEALIALWRRARDVTASMGEPLASLYDGHGGFAEGDPGPMLAERMPWATLALYAEGTVPELELADGPWTDAAARTPEAWDDAFLGLVTTAYDNASARGWTAWQRRSWDYGGCSPFGTGEGLHRDLLLRTDALATVPPVAPFVASIRAGVLADIEKPTSDEFPYCRTPGDPTPTDGLLSEAQA